jgi:hypothetical protein
MKRLVLIVTVLFFAAPLLSSDKNRQENAPVFKNEDLEKYRYPSDIKKPVDDSRTPKNNIDSKESNKIVEEGQQKLQRHEVSYKAYEGTAKRIIIPVKFNDSVTAPMLLDTGATGMHISVDLAGKLGLFEKDEGKLFESASGIGGTIPALLTIIDHVQVGEIEEHFIPTTVTRSFSSEFEGLVGMDFMVNFSIQIDTKRHVVIFEENPADQQMPGGHDEEWWRTNFNQFAVKREEWAKLRRVLYDYSGDLSKPITRVMTGTRTRVVTVGELRTFVDRQYQEADKLFRKLDRYAIDYAVPMEWREN